MTPNVSRLSRVNAISMMLDAQKRARYDCDDQEKMLMKWVFSACLQVLPHEQIFTIWEAVTRQTQIDFALPNIFIEIEKKTFLFVIKTYRENSQIIASASGFYVRTNVTKMGRVFEHITAHLPFRA